MSKKAEEAALREYPTYEGASPEWVKAHLSSCTEFIKGYEIGAREMYDFIHEFAHNYAWTEEDGTVHLPTFIHDFMKEARKFEV